MSHTELCRAKPAGRYVEFKGPSPPHANSKEAPWVWFEDDDVDDWTTSLEDKLASPISMCEGGNKEMQRMWDAGHRNRSRQTICYKMCKGNEYMTNSTLLKQGNALLARKLLQGVWSCASGITDVADKCLTKPSWRLGREAAIGIVEFVGAW